MPRKLSIIIVTYNSSFWLKKTLSTLKEHYLNTSRYAVETIVVDNNSTDDTQTILKEHFPWVNNIVLSENHGFGYANNRALETINSEYALLLNSDMEATTESDFDILLQYMESHPVIGIMTPKVVFKNGLLDPACHRGEPTLWNSFCYFSGLSKIFPNSKIFAEYHQTYKNFSSIHKIAACSGAALLISAAAIKKVGLLDERFFMYAEDLDWCKRVRDAGMHVVYNPKVAIIHHKYKSGLKSSSQKIARNTKRHFYDTMLQYFDKHYNHKYPAFVRKIVRVTLAIKKGGI